MSKFMFDLQQPIIISASGETGVVIGRAEFSYSEHNYLIRYKASDGRAAEVWWGNSAIEASDRAASEIGAA